MANEVTYASIGDLTVAAALSNQFLLLLADAAALPNHPALFDAGMVPAFGASSVIKVPHIGLMGVDIDAVTADGVAVANSALTDGSTSITIARYSKSYEATDLARMTQGGLLNIEMFAQDAVVSAAATLTELMAALMGSFSSVVGTSGANATMQNFLDAITTLEVAKVQGPYMAFLHPQQWGDIRADLALNAGGAVQFDPATAALIATRGIGFQGTLAGVDVFTSTRIPTANAGADRAGGMFGRGAVGFARGTIANDYPSGQSVVLGDQVLFERSRTAKSGLTAYVSHVYLGVSEMIDAAGVSIITDA